EATTGFCYADYSASSGGIDTEHSGCTGSGCIDWHNTAISRIEWQYDALEATSYEVTIRYANGATASRPGTLMANDNSGNAVQFAFNPTGAWSSWVEETVEMSLNAGSNRLVLSGMVADGLANVDFIRFKGAPVSGQTCSGSSS